MQYYNHRFKKKKSKVLMMKIVVLLGVVLFLFLLIWKMPAKQTTVTEEIRLPYSNTTQPTTASQIKC